MKEGKNNTVMLTIIGIATLLIAVVGATFAYFSAVLSGNESSTTITINSGTIGTVFDGGSIITVSDAYPRAEAWATKTFSIQSNINGATSTNYTLALVVSSNTFSSGSLKYTLTGTNVDGNGTLVPDVTTQTGISNVAGTYSLGTAGTFTNSSGATVTHTYSLVIYFPDTGTNQNADQGAILQAYVSIASA